MTEEFRGMSARWGSIEERDLAAMELEQGLEKPVDLANIVSDERPPLSYLIDPVLRHSLETAERLTEDETTRLLHEGRMGVLNRFYREAHDERQLPGRVFRSSNSGQYFVASLADWSSEEIYFYGGRFRYKNEQSPDLLGGCAEFLPDAANTNRVITALAWNALRSGHLADIECLPSTYPLRYLAEEKADVSHKYGEPSRSMVEEVLVADSLEAALSEFIKDWRDPFRRYFPARAVIYDGEKWHHIPLEEYNLGPWC